MPSAHLINFLRRYALTITLRRIMLLPDALFLDAYRGLQLSIYPREEAAVQRVGNFVDTTRRFITRSDHVRGATAVRGSS
jgi:hypothetical protein